jgi:hypothetical protein
VLRNFSGVKPNFDYLRERYGDSKVTVAICGVQEYNDQKRKQMKALTSIVIKSE